MKRVLSLVLALSMVMSMFTFSFAGSSLKDVAGTEYESAVEALVELGIVNGYKDGTYLPENVVSRSEMAKLLVVAAGLAPAAELAEGTTKFSDVAADHWATGYINVAAEYGYVMGDPDGSFRPDDTVSYAEAITMAIRVLGYKTVVEAKGTWPTNYIAKAEELDLLEDITYGTYAAGAARGNVALLIWNMLRTNMWDVREESEGDGLTYRDTGVSMLNTKFKDFKYGHAEFDSWANDEGEIAVKLDYAADYTDDITGTYTYTDTDFYTFVKGSIVEVLVNTKDKTLLSMVRTDDYKYFAGSEVEIDEEYDENNLSGEAYIYAYLRVDGKDIKDSVVVKAVSEYIYELDTSSTKRVKFNGTKGGSLNYEAYEEAIILKDGEFATVKDLEVGDVWTTVVLSSGQTIYMIASAEGEGKLTKLVEEKFENVKAGTYNVATIDGKEIVVAGEAVYFEDAEDVEDTEEATLISDKTPYDDMKNEVVTYVTDVFGRIVAVMFDGDLNKGGEDEGSEESRFYALNGPVERDGQTYTLAVATEDGEDELTFAKGKGNALWAKGADYAGQFVIMTLNDDEEIEVIGYDYSGETKGKYFVVRADDSGDVEETKFNLELVYNEDGDKYTVAGKKAVTFDENKLLVANNEWAKVNDDTVVVTLVFDDKGDKKDTNDEYRVEFAGIEALEGMKNDPALVITDNGESNFARAKYVVIFDEVSSREDDLVGIVKNVSKNKLGDDVITVVEDRDDEAKDGTEYILADGEVINDDIQFVMYSIEENKDGEWEFTLVDRLADHELISGEKNHAYIDESEKDKPSNVSDDGREVIFAGLGKFDMDDEDTVDALDNARIYIVNVVLDEDESETQYFVDNYAEVDYADVKLKELDRIKFVGAEFDATTSALVDADAVLIIRGMDAR